MRRERSRNDDFVLFTIRNLIFVRGSDFIQGKVLYNNNIVLQLYNERQGTLYGILYAPNDSH